MDCLVYSKLDSVAVAATRSIFDRFELELLKSDIEYKHFACDNLNIVEVNGTAIDTHFLDAKVHAERFIFISKHSSSKGITSFSSHALGNWSDSTEFGGKPKELGTASPKYMLKFLNFMRRNAAAPISIPVTYEATHHGPCLQKPSLFIEIGPVNENEALDGRIARLFAEGALETVTGVDPYFDKVALGIGGNHYPEKFTELALSGKYAFSHIMPRYYSAEYDMIEKAVKRTELPIDVAVIDWKSIKADHRNKIIKELDRVGIGYARV